MLGVLPGMVGLLQATEVLKLLLGIGEPLVGRLLTFDALGMRFREIRLAGPRLPTVCTRPPSSVTSTTPFCVGP